MVSTYNDGNVLTMIVHVSTNNDSQAVQETPRLYNLTHNNIYLFLVLYKNTAIFCRHLNLIFTCNTWSFPPFDHSVIIFLQNLHKYLYVFSITQLSPCTMPPENPPLYYFYYTTISLTHYHYLTTLLLHQQSLLYE